MRFFIALFLFNASCTFNFFQNSQIEKFKDCLGKEIALNLDSSVIILDSLLTGYYKGSAPLDKLYSQFVKDVVSSNVDWKHFFKDKDRLNNYYRQAVSSGLTDELYLKYKGYHLRRDFADNENLDIKDTAAIKVIQIDYEHLPKDSINGIFRSVSWFLSHSEKQNIDSVVLHAKAEIRLNVYDKYRKALELVSKNNKVVETYLNERKQYYGMVSPSLVLKGWEELEIDHSDYFVKRILATEILLLTDVNKFAIEQVLYKSTGN